MLSYSNFLVLFYFWNQGWWKYDDRTAAELEEMYKLGQETVEMLIAGASYVIDFQRQIQYPKNRPGRIRKIRRSQDDDPQIPKLGVAGIRFT